MPGAPKIFLDGTPLSGPPGGIRRFTEELYAALPAQWPAAEFGLISDQQEPRPQGWRKRWWSLGLAAALREREADLFHGVDFAVPYIPVCRSVMTVHDLSPWKLPDAHNQRVRERAGWLLRLRVPTMIHTPSVAVREELIQHFDWPEERVVAIPLAAAERFAPSERRVYERPYVLSVATLEPRKNLAIVVAACERLWAEGLDFDLVLVGQTREGFALAASERIHFAGYVAEGDLAAYYSHAVCTVYPSLYEGFGLPVVEAMRCGSPVIASDIAVLRESGGEAGVYAAVNDAAAWAAALRKVFEGKDEVRREAGLRWASTFSWNKTARAMKELYERCLG